MCDRGFVSALVVGGLLAACGGGGGGGGGNPTDPPPPGGGTVVTVELDEFTFQPRSVTVEPGQRVRWVLRGSDTTHTVTALDGSFDSGFAFNTPGATFERAFTEADRGTTFNYNCASHADCCDMKGSVRVGSNAPPPNPGYE
jgi:plastocyanin